MMEFKFVPQSITDADLHLHTELIIDGLTASSVPPYTHLLCNIQPNKELTQVHVWLFLLTKKLFCQNVISSFNSLMSFKGKCSF